MMFRLREADLALYESEECPYIRLESSWRHEEATAHFRAKWDLGYKENRPHRRLLPELPSPYDLGPSRPRYFLPWSATQILAKKLLAGEEIRENISD